MFRFTAKSLLLQTNLESELMFVHLKHFSCSFKLVKALPNLFYAWSVLNMKDKCCPLVVNILVGKQ